MKRSEKYGCESCKWFCLNGLIGGGNYAGVSGGRCGKVGKNLRKVVECPGREGKEK
jgi:hypothetical protein